MPAEAPILTRAREMRKYSREKAQEKRNLLEPYSSLIPPDVIALIVEREAESALTRYQGLREIGQMNDVRSTSPGISVFLTVEAADKAARMCKERGYPIPKDQAFDIKNPGSDMVSVIALRFPNGVYVAGRGEVQLFQEAGPDADSPLDSARNPFPVPLEGVVRIGGDHGELWQNPNYNWEQVLQTDAYTEAQKKKLEEARKKREQAEPQGQAAK